MGAGLVFWGGFDFALLMALVVDCLGVDCLGVGSRLRYGKGSYSLPL